MRRSMSAVPCSCAHVDDGETCDDDEDTDEGAVDAVGLFSAAVVTSRDTLTLDALPRTKSESLLRLPLVLV